MEFTTENKGNRTSLREFEKDLKEDGLLRLRPFFKKTIRNMSLKKFIINFLLEYNIKLETIFADSEELQCQPNKRRSGGDIFLICKYYYPECTLKDVLTVLDDLSVNGESNNINIKSQICRAINKRVFSSVDEHIVFHKDERDEFNRIVGQYLEEAE